MKERIIILGATSHIAKGLIYNFSRENKHELFLNARFPEKVRAFLKENRIKGKTGLFGLNELERKECDLLINCVGIGTPNKVRGNPALIFGVTEEYDKIITAYLSKFRRTRCINFSSGAVYGACFKEPVNERSSLKFAVNNIRPQDYYGLAKINSEAKHRACRDLNIVDIRIFAYFSRFIDLESGYFLTEMINAIKKGKEFITNPCDLTRDYLHLEDLFALAGSIMSKKPFNAAFDAYSRKPVKKFQILKYFAKKYRLRYKIVKGMDFNCPTGAKDIYCSNSRKAAELLGYKPKYTSMEAVVGEAGYILA